jgi:peptidoglycan/LPS O-acetylase OafA/YrhL
MHVFGNTSMPSLADQLALTRNRPAGFDYMRIALATTIICLHGANVTLGLGRALEIQSTLRIGIAMILALFFSLSGFLVTASLQRCKSLISFLGLRVLRIGPALAVETTLSAIIIGSIFTELPLAQYVADPKLHAYFLNIVGDIQYELPGVFLHNPMPDVVNAQLWTVPYELWCYVVLALLAVTTICFNRVAYLVFLVAVQVALLSYDIYRWDEVPIQLRPHLLVFCFLAGVGFYLWRDKVPFHRTLCLLALLACAAAGGHAGRLCRVLSRPDESAAELDRVVGRLLLRAVSLWLRHPAMHCLARPAAPALVSERPDQPAACLRRRRRVLASRRETRASAPGAGRDV